LPFGGSILSIDMTGHLLKQTLDKGLKNKGIGSYLQTAGVVWANDVWLINGEPLNLESHYGVAINDFLLTGREQGLEFLKSDNPGMQQKATHDDLRLALITQLQKTYGEQ
jgi:5'-nucleotidase